MILEQCAFKTCSRSIIPGQNLTEAKYLLVLCIFGLSIFHRAKMQVQAKQSQYFEFPSIISEAWDLF